MFIMSLVKEIVHNVTCAKPCMYSQNIIFSRSGIAVQVTCILSLIKSTFIKENLFD